MPKIVNPAAKRTFLVDPNYYRLGYQLVAQMMHREESSQEHKRRCRSAWDILSGDRVESHYDRPGPAVKAEDLIDDAEAVLRWFDDRRKTKKWRLPRDKLTVREERLERFQRRTVIPCLTIVIAASLRGTRPQESEEKIAPLHTQAEEWHQTKADKRPISYRALYNLACYEAGGDKPSKERVLLYLAAALNEAPGNRRQELGKWAGKDPSFNRFREDPAFQELLKPYE